MTKRVALFVLLAATLAAVPWHHARGPRIWAPLSPTDASGMFEITADKGLVIHAPPVGSTSWRVQRRLKSGTVWRAVTLPVTILPGEHVRLLPPLP